MEKDIFVGNYVKVAINPDATTINPSYFDPGYIESDNVSAFPSISISKSVQSVEDYREDFENKLSGDVQINDTTISVFSVADDPFIKQLDKALLNKERIRFRNLYVIDDEKYASQSQAGLYHIFDAFVTKKSTTGSNNSAVTVTYTLSADSDLTTGYAESGRPLYVGEYGVGAGTEEVPGVKDFGKLSGNRWITVEANDTTNPFGQGTSSMAVQHPDGQGWEIIGTSIGNPAIRIRNKKIEADGTIKQSKWIKVYSESEKPSSQDIGALPITGGTITGSLTINNKLTVKEISATTATIKTLNTTEIKSDSVKVKGEEVYSPSNKPKPIDINCVALGEILDAGEF